MMVMPSGLIVILIVNVISLCSLVVAFIELRKFRVALYENYKYISELKSAAESASYAALEARMRAEDIRTLMNEAPAAEAAEASKSLDAGIEAPFPIINSLTEPT